MRKFNETDPSVLAKSAQAHIDKVVGSKLGVFFFNWLAVVFDYDIFNNVLIF